jgi:hypothetical protein
VLAGQGLAASGRGLLQGRIDRRAISADYFTLFFDFHSPPELLADTALAPAAAVPGQAKGKD